MLNGDSAPLFEDTNTTFSYSVSATSLYISVVLAWPSSSSAVVLCRSEFRLRHFNRLHYLSQSVDLNAEVSSAFAICC
ncbi:Hypothetical predicted protein [Octopus vulgaris]|uniref:Uncharacterized protein n=1 Tax=Octopus vulgaris TaxID=6645 RepID=A0AA36FBD3_OCTVU|nr:Hypothetical predicted protein [Octopus vulgaris]